MQALEISHFPALRGKEAIQFLQKFIKKVKTEKSEELTSNQAATLINVAKGLISSIEAMEVSVNKSTEENHFVNRIMNSLSIWCYK